MIFDRRPYYLIGSAVGLLIVGYFVVFSPKVTPEQRVQEQLSILAREPWVTVQVQQVEVKGAPKDPDQVLLHGVRQADGSLVVIHFVAHSPYTSPSAMHRLVEQPLEGRKCDVLILPRSLAYEPFRDEFRAEATHVGVALFAGFPDRPVAAVNETTGEALPAARGSAPAPTVASRSASHG